MLMQCPTSMNTSVPCIVGSTTLRRSQGTLEHRDSSTASSFVDVARSPPQPQLARSMPNPKRITVTNHNNHCRASSSDDHRPKSAKRPSRNHRRTPTTTPSLGIYSSGGSSSLLDELIPCVDSNDEGVLDVLPSKPSKSKFHVGPFGGGKGKKAEERRRKELGESPRSMLPGVVSDGRLEIGSAPTFSRKPKRGWAAKLKSRLAQLFAVRHGSRCSQAKGTGVASAELVVRPPVYAGQVDTAAPVECRYLLTELYSGDPQLTRYMEMVAEYNQSLHDSFNWTRSTSSYAGDSTPGRRNSYIDPTSPLPPTTSPTTAINFSAVDPYGLFLLGILKAERRLRFLWEITDNLSARYRQEQCSRLVRKAPPGFMETRSVGTLPEHQACRLASTAEATLRFWETRINLSYIFEQLFQDTLQFVSCLPLYSPSCSTSVTSHLNPVPACDATAPSKFELTMARDRFLSSARVINAQATHLRRLSLEMWHCWQGHYNLREEIREFERLERRGVADVLRNAGMSPESFLQSTYPRRVFVSGVTSQGHHGPSPCSCVEGEGASTSGLCTVGTPDVLGRAGPESLSPSTLQEGSRPMRVGTCGIRRDRIRVCAPSLMSPISDGESLRYPAFSTADHSQSNFLEELDEHSIHTNRSHDANPPATLTRDGLMGRKCSDDSTPATIVDDNLLNAADLLQQYTNLVKEMQGGVEEAAKRFRRERHARQRQQKHASTPPPSSTSSRSKKERLAREREAAAAMSIMRRIDFIDGIYASAAIPTPSFQRTSLAGSASRSKYPNTSSSSSCIIM